jgi:hypothetical protein
MWNTGQILGGGQFDHAFSNCTNSSPTLPCTGGSPEQEAFNVLQVFFYGTLGAPVFAGGDGGVSPAPLNYLDVFQEDIVYAMSNCAAIDIKDPTQTAGPVLFSATAQDLLNMAAQSLAAISEPSTCWASAPLYYYSCDGGDLPTTCDAGYTHCLDQVLPPFGSYCANGAPCTQGCCIPQPSCP